MRADIRIGVGGRRGRGIGIDCLGDRKDGSMIEIVVPGKPVEGR